MPKTGPFARLRNLERAFAEFARATGHPYDRDSYPEWGKVGCSNRLDYAKSFNAFASLLPEGKFPPSDQFLIFCALKVYGNPAVELWRRLREHYCRGKPRGARRAGDEAFDVWYAMDAWLQSWLYSPLSCCRPKTNTPAEWLRCIGSNNPTPHLRMSYAFLQHLGLPISPNYDSARRELLDIKAAFRSGTLVPMGSEVPNIGPLLVRFPLIGWDIWQRAVYLLTNDVKPPSHMPIFGWRHHRVLSYAQSGHLVSPGFEQELLGHSFSLHGILWPEQLKTLEKLVRPARSAGPPVTSGRMLRRHFAH